MRIEIVTETFPPEINGVAMTLKRLADGMRDRGHRVGVVRPRQGKGDRGGVSDGLEHWVSRGVPIPGYAGLRFGWPAKRELRRLWAAHRPHVVHIATEGPLGWSAITAAKSLGIPVVSSYHTKFSSYSGHYNIGLARRLIARYLRLVHNRTSATLVPSTDSLRELSDDGYRNLLLLERGVDTELFTPQRRDSRLRSEWGCGNADPVVLYVGRLAKEKNLELLIAAYEAMKRELPQLRLVVVGDGPERERLQREHPQIRFPGPMLGENLARHYASADFFLFPSETETFGNVVLEALSSGLCVLAYDYAAAHRFIRSEVNGRTAPLGEREAFLRAARTLAEDVSSWGQARLAARESVLGRSWSSIVGQYETLLRRTIKKPISEPNLPDAPIDRQRVHRQGA